MFKQEDYTVQFNEEASDAYAGNNIDFHILNSGELEAISQLMPSLNSDVTPIFMAQEETLDVANKFYQVQPIWPVGPPERTTFSGEYNFQVEISATDVHRRKYLYSHILNRIYVDMRIPFPVTFRWDAARAPGPLFVRATVVFSEESQCEKRVERCTQHTHDNNADTNQTIVRNVLHSSRERNAQGVYYCGQPEQADSWYSVVVEFPSGPGTHAYQFGCKNSCPNGINRRAIDIIFALEDITGHTYGRQVVGARVCACPKRDMHKDEESEGKSAGKRKVDQTQGKAKKVKVDGVGDQEVIILPQLEIIGSRAVLAGLETMLRMMEQAADCTRSDAPSTDRYSSVIARLKAHIDGMKKTKSHL